MTARGNAIIQLHYAWEEAIRLNQPVTIRCAYCRFTAKGELYFARRKHRQHRLEKHPEAAAKARRPRSGRSPMMNASKPLDENIANARRQGASTWDGATE